MIIEPLGQLRRDPDIDEWFVSGEVPIPYLSMKRSSPNKSLNLTGRIMWFYVKRPLATRKYCGRQVSSPLGSHVYVGNDIGQRKS